MRLHFLEKKRYLDGKHYFEKKQQLGIIHLFDFDRIPFLEPRTSTTARFTGPQAPWRLERDSRSLIVLAWVIPGL